MEASLKASPDDLASHMAYADHLAEQGDPRGEFIQVQLALEDPARPANERDRLWQREQQLLQMHQAEWLGQAAPMFLKTRKELDDDGFAATFGLDLLFNPCFGCEYNSFQFARGWLDSLHLDVFNPALAEALGRSPTIALLPRLTIDRSEPDNPGYDVLEQWPCLGNLRRFQLGNADQCHISGDGIAAVIGKLTRIEELYLYAHSVDVEAVFTLPMPNLRALHAWHLNQYPFEVLAANPSLGNLITLSCWPHALEWEHDRAYIQLDSFQALVRSPYLKSLTHLALHLTDIGDEGMIALVESGLLRQLRILDLHNGRVSDEGARTLAGCPDLRRLEKFRLSGNQLTSDGVALLRATGVNLQADNQYTPEQVAVNEHLWEGDME
jgi:uncharacterized protein (TIGR02996 family)